MSYRAPPGTYLGKNTPYVRFYEEGDTLPDINSNVRRRAGKADFFSNVSDDPVTARTWTLLGGGNDSYIDWQFGRHFANELELAMPLVPAYSGGSSALNLRESVAAGFQDQYGNWLTDDPGGSYVQAKTGVFLKAGSTAIRDIIRTKYYLISWNNKAGNESFTGNDILSSNVSNSPIKLGLGHQSFVTYHSARSMIYHNSGYQDLDQMYLYFDFAMNSNGADITKIDLDSIDFRECDASGNVTTTGRRSTYWVSQAENFDWYRFMDQTSPYSPARSVDEMVTSDCHFNRKGGFEDQGGVARYGSKLSEIFKAAYDAGCKGAWINVPAWIGSPVNHIYSSRSVSGNPTISGTLAGPHAVPGSFSKVSDLNDGGGTPSTTVDSNGNYTYTQSSAYSNGRFGGFSFQYTDTILGVQTGYLFFKEQYDSIYISWRDNSQSEPYPGTSVSNAPLILHLSKWEDYVDFVLDEIEASGVPTSFRIYIEYSNEVWNTGGGAFNSNWNHISGIGVYLKNTLGQSQDGASFAAGWIDGMLLKLFKDRQAARSLSYDIVLVAAGQSAGSTTVSSRIDGARAYFTYNSLDYDDYIDETTYVGSVASYQTNLFNPQGAYDPPGISGQADSATNLAWWQDQVANNTSLAADCIAWCISGTSHSFNNTKLLAEYAGHVSACSARNTIMGPSYEGSWHNNMPSNLIADANILAWYYAEVPAIVATVMDDLWSRQIAAYPTVGLGKYGLSGPMGPYTGVPNTPWDVGYYEDREPVWAVCVEYGRLGS